MKLAIALQILLLFFHQATTLFDFYPFNGVRFSRRQERRAEAAFNFFLMAPAPIGFILGSPLLIRAGATFYPILFACELATWFVPYFIGASPRWEEIYSRVQGRTLMVIPRRGDNPTPNLEHLILMALTVAAAWATIVAYRSLPGASFGGWSIAITLAVGLVMVGGVAATHWKLPQGNRTTPGPRTD
jgi:hypothetical protein